MAFAREKVRELVALVHTVSGHATDKDNRLLDRDRRVIERDNKFKPKRNENVRQRLAWLMSIW